MSTLVFVLLSAILLVPTSIFTLLEHQEVTRKKTIAKRAGGLLC
jgi:hypothetical protein